MNSVESKKGLHSVSVKATKNVFIQNGKTDYKLWADETALAQKAADFIIEQVKLATGAEIEKVCCSQAKTTEKIIVLCDNKTAEKIGVTMPQADYRFSGYYIKTVGEKVYLCVNHRYGYQLAAISFLKNVVGYVAYAPDTIRYEKVGETVYMPELEITERADVDLRISGTHLRDLKGLYAMGYGDRFDYTMKLKGKPYHTSLLAAELAGMTPDENDEHPWLSDNKVARRQLCYTAHGNEQELEKMVQGIAKVIIDEMELPENLEKSVFTLGIEDRWGQCECPACTKEKEKYGVDAAAMIKVFNRINRVIQAHLQEKADQEGVEKRLFKLLFFGYKFTQQPPVKKVNGKWQPVDESVICDDEVGVFFAPIHARYSYSFNHPINAAHKEHLLNWSLLTKNIWFWGYSTNFRHLFYPNGIMRQYNETYQMCLDAGVEFMYNQGTYMHMTTHFTPVKEYLDSKISFDCTENMEELIGKFFDNYYGVARKPLKRMFNSIELYYRHLITLYPHIITGFVYDEINQPSFWPEGLLKEYLSCIEEAYGLIEPLKETDRAEYDRLYNHILRESMFPRFAMLELHSEAFGKTEWVKETTAFKKDCETLGITLAGFKTMEDMYKLWEYPAPAWGLWEVDPDLA